jgi:hypothetical protein
LGGKVNARTSLLAFPTITALAIIASACAKTEIARFQARDGQQTMVRDGNPAIVSRRGTSLVMVRPASRQFKAGKRPTYVVAMNNMGGAPLQFSMANLWVGQLVNGKVARGLRVYKYEDLVQEERNRQVAAAVATGLAAGANAYSAANAGYYNANATVYGPRGSSNVSIAGYDPTARAIAQSQAAAQNDAMIASTIETGRRNLDVLEKAVIKDNTLFPGEWYGGAVQFDPPEDAAGKNIVIRIQVGPDLHQVEVTHEPT